MEAEHANIQCSVYITTTTCCSIGPDIRLKPFLDYCNNCNSIPLYLLPLSSTPIPFHLIPFQSTHSNIIQFNPNYNSITLFSTLIFFYSTIIHQNLIHFNPLLQKSGFTKKSNIMPLWIMSCLVLMNHVTWTSFKLLVLYDLACHIGWIY